MADDPGVMGNLPRSRPGRRSEKRASGGAERSGSGGGAKRASGGAAAKAARASAKPASRGASARAKPKGRAAGGAQRRATSRSRAREQAPDTAVREERVEVPDSQGQDPITAALRLGMAVGDAGLKAVAKLASRLPRP